MPKPRTRKKKHKPVFRPLSPATRSKCRRLEDEEISGGIVTVAENAEAPLSPSAIHELIGGTAVCTIWDVRRCLFKMQDIQIMKRTGDNSWILYEKYGVIEENDNEVEAEDPVHMNDTTGQNTSAECMCPNAGDRCHHLHMHCHQHWTVNNYIQNGNGNRMFTGQDADFHHTFQRPFSTV